jgi:hypothetical protein
MITQYLVFSSETFLAAVHSDMRKAAGGQEVVISDGGDFGRL